MDRLAELHIHLEGSVTPGIVCELNPEITLEEARSMYEFDDFRGFIRTYVWVNQQLDRPARYAQVLRRLLHEYQRQNVVYAEVNLSVGVILWKEQDFEGIFEALDEVAEASPVRVRWIFDAVRQFGAEAAARVAELAISKRNRGVVGFGFGGDESRGPAEWFAEVCAAARNSGVAILPHAGETVGPESIWAALDCGARRIGHGIRAIDDPILVRHLAARQIPLEISITSNLCTGSVGSLAEHPIRKLFDAGVPLTLNTDDPGLFNTSLESEYRLARDVFGFTAAELELVSANAFRFAIDAKPEVHPAG